MSFETLEAFLSMGGHGPYVWTVYLTTLVLLVVNFAGLRRQRLHTLRDVRSLHSAAPAHPAPEK